MKISKSLLAGMLAVGLAGVASAQTEVYICGSTAYRGGVTKAIQDVLALNSTGFNEAWDGGSGNKGIYGAGAAIFSGTYGGNWTIVHTYWTGSAAGVIDVSYPNQITKWIPDTVTMTPGVTPTNGTNGYGGGTNVYNTYTAITAYPTVAMSDAFASSVGKSVATAPRNVGLSATAGTVFQAAINAANLTQAGSGESVVGLLPFVWVAGAQTSGTSPITDMTQEAASQLISKGYIPVTMLSTGTSDVLAGDTNDYAFLIGRNEDSGTRIDAQAEAQVGSSLGKQPFGNAMKQSYALFTSTNSISSDGNFPSGVTVGGSNAIETGGTAATVSDIGLWPANAPVNTEPNINWDAAGHSGQIGGGDVAAVLEAANPLTLNLTAVDGGSNKPSNWVAGTSKAYLLGYLGLADYSGIPAASQAHALSYNGIPYNAANILNGTYTFWSFEHMYYTTTATLNPVGAGQAIADAICDKLYTLDCQTDGSGNTDSSAIPNSKVGGIIFNGAHFSRTQEGAPVSPTF